jgi:site-specific recombinase XerD
MLPTDPALIRKQQIEEFVVWLLRERNAKPATVANRLSVLRTFFNWCVRAEEIEHTPMAQIGTPKVDEPPPEILNPEEVRRLIDACRGGGFEDRRDMAIIRLMLNSGMRRFEVASIMREDIDLKEGIVKITRAESLQPPAVITSSSESPASLRLCARVCLVRCGQTRRLIPPISARRLNR